MLYEYVNPESLSTNAVFLMFMIYPRTAVYDLTQPIL